MIFQNIVMLFCFVMSFVWGMCVCTAWGLNAVHLTGRLARDFVMSFVIRRQWRRKTQLTETTKPKITFQVRCWWWWWWWSPLTLATLHLHLWRCSSLSWLFEKLFLQDKLNSLSRFSWSSSPLHASSWSLERALAFVSPSLLFVQCIREGVPGWSN